MPGRGGMAGEFSGRRKLSFSAMEQKETGKLSVLVMPKPGSPFYSVTVSKAFLACLAIAVAALIAFNAWLIHGYLGLKKSAGARVQAVSADAPLSDSARRTGPLYDARVSDLEDTARFLLNEMRELRRESGEVDKRLRNLYREDEIKKLPDIDKSASPRGSLAPDLGEVETIFAAVGTNAIERRNFLYLAGAKIEQAENGVARVGRARREAVSRFPEGSPVADGRLTSPAGMRIHPISGVLKFHRGVDIGGWLGDYIFSAAAGLVTSAGWHGGYGQEIEIDHGNGFVTKYAHLETMYVRKGDMVGRGALIGLMGSTGYSTGPHLHYEVLYRGKPADPEIFMGGDPAEFL